jgi:arylsulfatase A-like enzyme
MTLDSVRSETDHAIEPMTLKDNLGPIKLLALALWCGPVAGLAEVASILVYKRFFDANQLLGMTRHFVWLVPLTDSLILLIAGLAGVLLVAARPAAGRWLLPRLLCLLTILPALLVLLPMVYGAALVLVAVGIAMRLVPLVERRPLAFRRVVLISSPFLALSIAVLTALPWLSDWRKQQYQKTRPNAPGPNILLIVMDTVAADHLALYGYGRPTSPAIDALARRGVKFEAATSATSWTLPSHSSMFTGRWPHELSVGWRTPLDASAPTIAEYLRDRGYATAGFVANMMYCATDSGLGRGFTVYRDYIFRELSPLKLAVLVKRSFDAMQTSAELVADNLDLDWPKVVVTRIRERFESDRKEADVVNLEFLDWLTDRPEPDRPYFAFLNYCDAHTPYQLGPRRMHRFGLKPSDPREFRLIQEWWTMDKTQLTPDELNFVFNAYDDCVASIDEQIGRLFDELDRRKALDNTWVILVSDHGESFGEHPGIFLHGSSLYQSELHVPLLVIPPPGIPVKPVVSETVSLRNLAATLVTLSEEVGSPFPGVSLSESWRPQARSPDDPDPSSGALAELVPNETLEGAAPGAVINLWPLGALLNDRWSYIRREGEVKEELYHLRDDPREQRNIAASPETRARLEQMRGQLSRLTDGPLTPRRFNP